MGLLPKVNPGNFLLLSIMLGAYPFCSELLSTATDSQRALLCPCNTEEGLGSALDTEGSRALQREPEAWQTGMHLLLPQSRAWRHRMVKNMASSTPAKCQHLMYQCPHL